MPSSHLPRTPCDKFVYDFPCGFWGIIGGYGLRHMCSHYLRASCDFLSGASGATRGKSVQRLCGDCTEIVRSPCGGRPSHGARAGIVQCHLRHVYGLRSYHFFKFVKLLAKPNRRGREVWIRTQISQPPPPASAGRPRGGRTGSGIWAGYGLRRPIASQMWTTKPHFQTINALKSTIFSGISDYSRLFLTDALTSLPLIGKPLSPHCLVPWKGLKAIGPLVACLLAACFPRD